MRGVVTAIEEAIRRLEAHFERVEVCPPAPAAALADLRKHTPGLPGQLRAFYALANGLRVGLRDAVAGHLFSAEEVLEHHRIGFAHHPSLQQLLPLRGDGCGNFDCIVAAGEIAPGSVVFWDREIYDRPSHLLGSTFASYLEMWSDALVHDYLANGELQPSARAPELDRWPWLGTPERRHPWPFDGQWVARHDPGVARLLASPEVLRWLARRHE